MTPLPLVAIEHQKGRFASARLDVPRDATFFADHFPRRPVFPGTLLLDRMTVLASGVVSEAAPGRSVTLRRVTDVKLRAFTEPGSRLELRATVDGAHSDAITVELEARAEGQRRPVGAATASFEVRP
jgi:3-hydroxyacyl-[acyl-carrier-protein] dehydratase